jgi:hypothetical protein
VEKERPARADGAELLVQDRCPTLTCDGQSSFGRHTNLIQFYQFTGVRIQPRYISKAPLFMANGRFN